MEKIIKALLCCLLFGCSSMPQHPIAPIHVPVYFGGYVCNPDMSNMEVFKPTLGILRYNDAYIMYQYSHCSSA